MINSLSLHVKLMSKYSNCTVNNKMGFMMPNALHAFSYLGYPLAPSFCQYFICTVIITYPMVTTSTTDISNLPVTSYALGNLAVAVILLL